MIELSPAVEQNKIRIDGYDVSYSSRGPADAPLALVGVHGLAGGGDSLWPLLAGVPDNVRVLLPDQPGCGDSEELPEAHTVEAYTAWFHRFIARTHKGRVVMISIATGAPITLRYAREYPEETAGLIFSLPFLGKISLPRAMRYVAAYALDLGPLRALIDRARASDDVMHRIITHEPPEAIPVLAERDIDHKQQASLRAAGEFLHDLMLTDSRRDLAHVNTPLLFLTAEHDGFAPQPLLRAIIRKHSERRLVTMPNMGHSWNEEFLQVQNDAIGEFFKQLESGNE